MESVINKDTKKMKEKFNIRTMDKDNDTRATDELHDLQKRYPTDIFFKLQDFACQLHEGVKKTGKIDLDIHKKLRKFIIQKSQRKEDRVKLLLYATSYYMQTLTQGSCDI
jgi:hypothetical protein